MQSIFNFDLPEQEILKQILSNLDVQPTNEIAAMKAGNYHILAKAYMQNIPHEIFYRRYGNREKLETFLQDSISIREIPSVRRNILRTKINDNFIGELELYITNSNTSDAETAFRNAISTANSLFEDIVTTQEHCLILRATAVLYELVPFSYPFDAEI